MDVITRVILLANNDDKKGETIADAKAKSELTLLGTPLPLLSTEPNDNELVTSNGELNREAYPYYFASDPRRMIANMDKVISTLNYIYEATSEGVKNVALAESDLKLVTAYDKVRGGTKTIDEFMDAFSQSTLARSFTDYLNEVVATYTKADEDEGDYVGVVPITNMTYTQISAPVPATVPATGTPGGFSLPGPTPPAPVAPPVVPPAPAGPSVPTIVQGTLDGIRYDVDLLADEASKVTLLNERFNEPTTLEGEGQFDTERFDYFYNLLKSGALQDADLVKQPHELLAEELENDLQSFGMAPRVRTFDDDFELYYEEKTPFGVRDYLMEHPPIEELVDRYNRKKNAWNGTLLEGYVGDADTNSNAYKNLANMDKLKIPVTLLDNDPIFAITFDTSSHPEVASTAAVICAVPEILSGWILKSDMVTSNEISPIAPSLIIAMQTKIKTLLGQAVVDDPTLLHISAIAIIILTNYGMATNTMRWVGNQTNNVMWDGQLGPIFSLAMNKLGAGLVLEVDGVSNILGDEENVLENTSVTYDNGAREAFFFVEKPDEIDLGGLKTFTKSLLNRFYDNKSAVLRALPGSGTIGTIDAYEVFDMKRMVESYQGGWSITDKTAQQGRKIVIVNQ